MITCDTSVVVAALSDWHEQHQLAFGAVGEVGAIPAHVLIEAYSVLTRLPQPYRVQPEVAADALNDFLSEPLLVLPTEEVAQIPGRLAAARLCGGATYDALIALTAAANQAELLTLDQRAATTYIRLGVTFRMLT